MPSPSLESVPERSRVPPSSIPGPGSMAAIGGVLGNGAESRRKSTRVAVPARAVATCAWPTRSESSGGVMLSSQSRSALSTLRGAPSMR